MPIVAAPLLAGLKKAGVDVAMKSFQKSTKSIEKTAKMGGFKEFGDAVNQLAGFTGAFKPLMTPLKVLGAQLNAEIMPHTIGLMNEGMELLAQPSTQRAMKTFAALIGAILDGAAIILDTLNKLNDALETFKEKSAGTLQEPIDPLDPTTNPIYDWFYNNFVRKEDENPLPPYVPKF